MNQFRKMVVDAAVRELRHQIDERSVEQSGSFIQVDSGFKMGRLAEAIINAALDPQNDILVEDVARNLAPDADDWEDFKAQAMDAILAMSASVRHQLDPQD